MDLRLDIFELADRYRKAELTPSEVVGTCLDRIRAFDTKMGAFQLLTADVATKAAAKADDAFTRREAVGPLLGIPFSVKDIYDIQGYVTGKGQSRTGQPIADKSATVVNRLLSAGAILLGKTKTVEIAMGGWGVNKALGTPWNPWDVATHRVPGGSSSGSAVAVAAGFSAFALGTDTGGSVRLPAAFCGVTGLNVTANCLPTEGIMPLSPTLDTPGPITRTILDAAILFEVMGGRAPSLISRDLSSGSGLCGTLHRGIAIDGLRIGAINDQERDVCTAEILHAYDSAIEDLRRLGATVERISSQRTYAEIAANIGALINAEAFEFHGAYYRSPEFPVEEYVRERVLAGARVSAATQQRILDERSEIQSAFQRDIQEFDALTTPTTPTTAIPVAEVDGAVNAAHFTRPFNFLGMCAVAVPIGLTSMGLPTSLQIAARSGNEEMALRISAAFERERGPIGNPPMSQLY